MFRLNRIVDSLVPHPSRWCVVLYLASIFSTADHSSLMCRAAESEGFTKPPITALAFASDGKTVVAASQSGVHVFNWPDLNRLRTIETSLHNLHCLVFSPDGKLLAVGGGVPSDAGGVQLFSWPSGESVKSMDDHEDSVLALAWRDKTTIVSGSVDRQIKLWNHQQETIERSYSGHSRSVSALCLLNDRTTLVSAGADHSLRIWDLASGQVVRNLNQHTKRVNELALRPNHDGLPMVASAAADRTIRFWQPTIGRMVRYIRLQSEPLNIAWLQDGSRIIAACVDGRIRVINPEEVKVTQTVEAIQSWAYAIAVHPTDDSIVVAGAGGEIRRIEHSQLAGK